MKSLILCTDAYGGRGGIALYNRNFIRAVSECPGMEEVVVVPRKIYYELEKIPENIVHFKAASKNIQKVTPSTQTLFERNSQKEN